MSGTDLTEAFQIGDLVVYPKNGIGIIKNIEDRKGLLYLKINITNPESMDVLAPLANAERIGIRHLENEEEVKAALEGLSVEYDDQFKDWKARLQANQELFNSGKLSSIAKVISILYRRSKIKELPTQERKLYDDAIAFLAEEASVVLKKEKEEMRKEIFICLEK